ncbi:MAG: hypothetical protein J5798_09975 [Spirochaetaceae bacterium]|nr:hypothetical protein [Spirochaetaceae bacterium]
MSKTLNGNLKEYKISEIPYIRLMGRNIKGILQSGKPVPLFWSASCLEVKAKSSEVWALVETDYSVYEVWLTVWINGRIVSRFMAEKGKNWICLCRGFSAETVNTVRLMRDTQAMSEDPDQICLVHSLAIDDGGAFQSVEKKKLKIEFVGDSLTSGEGLYGNISEQQWISTWISGSKTYAVRTADALNADFSVVSQCGWGIVSGWNNNIQTIIPPYYEQICGLCKGEKQKKLGSTEPFDFSAVKNDFVFIYLGANDYGAFFNPAWVQNGKEYKLRQNPDGSFVEEDAMKVAYAVKDFLKVVRKNNPDSRLCWLWGTLDMPELSPYLEKGVAMYIEETGDKKTDILQLPSKSLEKEDEDKGSRDHPGPLSHKNASEKLIEYCRKFL